MLRKWDQSKEREIAIVCFYEELPVWTIGEVFSAEMTEQCFISLTPYCEMIMTRLRKRKVFQGS